MGIIRSSLRKGVDYTVGMIGEALMTFPRAALELPTNFILRQMNHESVTPQFHVTFTRALTNAELKSLDYSVKVNPCLAGGEKGKEVHYFVNVSGLIDWIGRSEEDLSNEFDY